MHVSDDIAGYRNYSASPPSDVFGAPGALNAGLEPFHVRRADGGFVPPPDDLAELEARAMQVLLPGIKSEMSLINSIIELKDFKSLPKTLSTIKSLPKLFKTKAFWRNSKNSQKTLRELLRRGSDYHLSYSFGIAPFLNDIASLVKAVKRTEGRMNDLVNREGKPQRRHFAYRWDEFDSDDSGLVDESELRNGISLGQIDRYSKRRVVKPESSVFHAEIEYNYQFTQYQREHARLGSFLDALGLNINPAIIWNAIPWTFVVDWVVNVSSWLDNFKVEHMEPRINIRRYLWSVLRKRTIVVSVSVTDNTSAGAVADTAGTRHLPAIREVAYRRQVGMPSSSSLSTSGVSLKELTLGASLVFSRRYHPKPKSYYSDWGIY
jgi:hypothetical protein